MHPDSRLRPHDSAGTHADTSVGGSRGAVPKYVFHSAFDVEEDTDDEVRSAGGGSSPPPVRPPRHSIEVRVAVVLDS